MARKHISRSLLNTKKCRVRVVSKEIRQFQTARLKHITEIEEYCIQAEKWRKEYCTTISEHIELKDKIDQQKRIAQDLRKEHNDTATYIRQLETQERCPIPNLVKERQWQNREKILSKVRPYEYSRKYQIRKLPESHWIATHTSDYTQAPFVKRNGHFSYEVRK
jgi:hypothetical protein